MIYPPFAILFAQNRGDAVVLGGFVSAEDAQLAFLRGERSERPWLSPLDFGIAYAVDRPVVGKNLVYAKGLCALDLAAKGISLHALKRAGTLADAWALLDRRMWVGE